MVKLSDEWGVVQSVFYVHSVHYSLLSLIFISVFREKIHPQAELEFTVLTVLIFGNVVSSFRMGALTI